MSVSSARVTSVVRWATLAQRMAEPAQRGYGWVNLCGGSAAAWIRAPRACGRCVLVTTGTPYRVVTGRRRRDRHRKAR